MMRLSMKKEYTQLTDKERYTIEVLIQEDYKQKDITELCEKNT